MSWKDKSRERRAHEAAPWSGWFSPDSICQTACKVITKGRHVTDGQLQEEMDRFSVKS